MNHVIITGNLGRDPEVKGTVTKLSVATTRKYKDNSGAQQEKTQWHRVTAFGKTGEIIAKFFKKGKPITIIGRIEYSEYLKDGVKMHGTDIIAEAFEFVPGSGKGAGSSAGDDALDRATGMVGDTFDGAKPVDDSDGIPF